MRVQLRRGEDGAAAIIVALLVVIFVGLTAFATDFGLAYTSKRQFQAGSDAGALAAAISLAQEPGSCQAIAGDSAAVAKAQDQADITADGNRFDASSWTPSDLEIACPEGDRTLEVTYTMSGTSPRIFGSIYGEGDYALSRTATAEVYVVPGGPTGVRPYFICGADVDDLIAASSNPGTKYALMKYPSDNPECPGSSGNWFTSDCPDDGNNGTLDENTAAGCQQEVAPVDVSAADADGDGSLSLEELKAECANQTSAPVTCLHANPGNVASQVVVQAWDELIGDVIGLPIFKEEWNDLICTGGAKGGGNNCKYPIEQLVAAKVCGYKWQNKTGWETAVDPDCGAIPPFPGDTNDSYLAIKLDRLITSGSYAPAPGCTLSDPTCGFRSAHLIK